MLGFDKYDVGEGLWMCGCCELLWYFDEFTRMEFKNWDFMEVECFLEFKVHYTRILALG